MIGDSKSKITKTILGLVAQRPVCAKDVSLQTGFSLTYAQNTLNRLVGQKLIRCGVCCEGRGKLYSSCTERTSPTGVEVSPPDVVDCVRRGYISIDMIAAHLGARVEDVAREVRGLKAIEALKGVSIFGVESLIAPVDHYAANSKHSEHALERWNRIETIRHEMAKLLCKGSMTRDDLLLHFGQYRTIARNQAIRLASRGIIREALDGIVSAIPLEEWATINDGPADPDYYKIRDVGKYGKAYLSRLQLLRIITLEPQKVSSVVRSMGKNPAGANALISSLAIEGRVTLCRNRGGQWVALTPVPTDISDLAYKRKCFEANRRSHAAAMDLLMSAVAEGHRSVHSLAAATNLSAPAVTWKLSVLEELGFVRRSHSGPSHPQWEVVPC